jgi:O-antigen/teichoic acid export membrane protein
VAPPRSVPTWLPTRHAARAGLSVVDQGVASAGNLLLTVVAARALSVEDFGAFSIVFTLGMLAVGVTRALATEPLLVRFSASTEDEARAATRSAVGSVAVLGLCIGGLFLVAGWAVGSALGRAMTVMSLGCAAVVVQDAWRLAAFTLARPGVALVNDLVWIAVLLAGLAIHASAGPLGLVGVVVVWSAASAAGALLGALHLRLAPRVGDAFWWLRRRLDLGGRFCLDYLAAGGVAYVTLLILAAMVGFDGAAAVRGVQTIFGPVNVAFTGAVMVVVPEGARLLARGDSRFTGLVRTVGVVLTGGATVWLALALVAPEAVGTALLGESWDDARDLLPLMGIGLVAGGTAGAAFIGLRCLADARRTLATRLALVPMLLVVPVLATLAWSTEGFAVGTSVCGVVAAGVWWWQYRRALASGPA